jgi:hypothetical protein
MLGHHQLQPAVVRDERSAMEDQELAGAPHDLHPLSDQREGNE